MEWLDYFKQTIDSNVPRLRQISEAQSEVPRCSRGNTGWSAVDKLIGVGKATSRDRPAARGS